MFDSAMMGTKQIFNAKSLPSLMVFFDVHMYIVKYPSERDTKKLYYYLQCVAWSSGAGLVSVLYWIFLLLHYTLLASEYLNSKEVSTMYFLICWRLFIIFRTEYVISLVASPLVI